ncbi:hypothetical protein D7Y23_34920 [Corallococcus sp. AB050B]|nr:hypothetical protein D7Y23_34920 [Corallococcus sp. AB050B]
MSALAHALRMKFGTAPGEPNDKQLKDIVAYVGRIKSPTDADWGRAVALYCPTAGTYKYAGENASDLNVLLLQMQAQAQAPKK